MRELQIDNNNERFFNLKIKVYDSLVFYEIIQKVICGFNELFVEEKFQARFKEYSKENIDKNYSLKLSKKNGYPKVDCPSK